MHLLFYKLLILPQNNWAETIAGLKWIISDSCLCIHEANYLPSLSCLGAGLTYRLRGFESHPELKIYAYRYEIWPNNKRAETIAESKGLISPIWAG